MEAITITLDGVAVSGYPGMTILELAQESGVEIPTLCHEPYLAPVGACRLCLVENEQSGALVVACATPIAPGMVIATHSPRVIERRRVIVQLLLASHPDSCLVCDKGNRCKLRQIAAELGVGLVELQRIPQAATIEEVNPFIERDLSKCILCAKCIRVDQELVVEGAIDYIGRGFASRPSTVNNTPLEQSECTFCGSCVAICPTGALMEKERAYGGTTSHSVDSVCPFCGCGCSISLEVKDNHLVRVIPGTASPVNRGTLCVRGSYGCDFVHSPERLTAPLVKVNGEFEPVSWEQALERVASEFNRIKEKHGADSLAVLGSSKCTNEENYLLQRLARAVIGTNNIDNGSRLYSSARRLGLERSAGIPATPNSIEDLEQAGVIMVIGADPTVSAPAVGYAIKRAVRYRGARLLLIDPRQTKLAQFANLWLRPRPGTDIALVNGLARVMIEEKLVDAKFSTGKTKGFTELVSSLKKYTPEYVAEVTGVPTQDVVLAARLFAGAESAAIVYGNGITQHVSGVDSILALTNIARLTGNISNGGGDIFALQRENNARGAGDMGSLPDFLPGYQGVDDAQARGKFEERWGVSPPDGSGLTALEMIEQADKGSLKAMLIVGENPTASFPDSALVKNALAALEFLVVADMFLTETARLAEVVLPAASFAEKEGTFTNFEGRVQKLNRAIEPIGDSRPDWAILLEMARYMGQPMPYSSLQEVRNEIDELVPKKTSVKPGLFIPVEYKPVSISGDGYPLTLLTGSVLPHFGSGTRSLRAWRLKKFSPAAWVEVSGGDAQRLGLADSDPVKVVSPVGEVTAAVRVTEALPQGMLFMPISFPESPVNDLWAAGVPDLKTCAVRLERMSADG
ncbi:MAG TPA: molybdopterin-dependent oxidoreductase [Dehalococcoidia bacterium]|nr:molybdopterin-dependent oxidoreductase [Dehalococcoidia bacterium]